MSLAMLSFEILQTMTMSLRALESGAFFVIALCLLGLGAGGTITVGIARLGKPAPNIVLRNSAIGFSVSVLGGGLLAQHTASLWSFALIGVIPFLFVGVFLSFAFQTFPGRINRLYFFDLLGSAIGCVAAIALVSYFASASSVLLFVAVLALLAACLVTRRSRLLPICVLIAVVMLSPWASDVLEYEPSRDKGLGKLLAEPRAEAEITWSKWGYLGRLDVVKLGRGAEHFPYGGAHSALMISEGVDVRFLFASGGNWTRALDFRGRVDLIPKFVRHNRNSLAYLLTERPDVLNIGFGGGIDPFLAIQHDAASITAVDINPLMIEADKRHLKGFYEGALDDPRVSIELMDGRAFVRSTQKQFDVISLTAVDTGEALHQNAHVVLESYLYTMEAFDDYFSVLRPEGFLYFVRPRMQTMRLLRTGVDALRRRGVRNPARHIVVLPSVGHNAWTNVLISMSPLTATQRERITGRYTNAVYHPPSTSSGDRLFEQFLRVVAQKRDNGFQPFRGFDVTPIVDDRPLFYDFGVGILDSYATKTIAKALLYALIIALLLILLPAWWLRRNSEGKGPLARAGVYFASIGVGFMFIEIGVIQKLVLFLGHPTYSVTVTLFSVLLFSGIGSLCANRWSVVNAGGSLLVWVGVLCGALFYAFGLDYVLGNVAISMRIPIVVLLLAPASFFMGMPFPIMLREMDKRGNGLIPFGWAINAFASVIASIVSVLAAIHIGFTAVIVLGGAMYGIAAVALVLERKTVVTP